MSEECYADMAGGDCDCGRCSGRGTSQMMVDAKDAKRYRLLRRGQNWSVIDGIGDELRSEALDAAIDAAMLKTPNTGNKAAQYKRDHKNRRNA